MHHEDFIQIKFIRQYQKKFCPLVLEARILILRPNSPRTSNLAPKRIRRRENVIKG